MTTLYKISNRGAMQVWEIWETSNAIKIRWGQLNGSMQLQTVFVELNQSGRSLPEQICLEIDSRISSQIDKGYCSTPEEAEKSIGLNAAKMYKPMLAQKMSDSFIDYKKCFIQHKYDGHRCLVTKNDGKVMAYSRNGKKIITIDHILDNLNISEGETLDGELYIHDRSLQEISSIVRRVQQDNALLEYVVYDLINTQTYENRLNRLYGTTFPDNVRVAPTWHGSEVNDLKEELGRSIESGYEGLMLRANTHGYEPGKRSKSLVKVKRFLDSEFQVIGIFESKDGWAILECTCNSGTFRVSAPGTISDKTDILDFQDYYIGKYVTVEYAGLTNSGLPFHPIAKCFRESI
jgi:ATP-dependent DNA ligase